MLFYSISLRDVHLSVNRCSRCRAVPGYWRHQERDASACRGSGCSQGRGCAHSEASTERRVGRRRSGRVTGPIGSGTPNDERSLRDQKKAPSVATRNSPRCCLQFRSGACAPRESTPWGTSTGPASGQQWPGARSWRLTLPRSASSPAAGPAWTA